MSNENIFLEEEKIIHEIKLDLAHSITSNFVRIMQYDDGISVIRANIFEYYQPVDVPAFRTIVFRLKKPDGNVVIYTSNIETDKFKINNDSVDINIDNNMSDTYGRCSAVLDFVRADGHIQSTTFILIVDRNPVQRGESSTNVPIDMEAKLLEEIARATAAENELNEKIDSKLDINIENGTGSNSLVQRSELEGEETNENVASQWWSAAFGRNNRSTNYSSFTAGTRNLNNGDSSFVSGVENETKEPGMASITTGVGNDNSGRSSIVAGEDNENTAGSRGSLTVGHNNTSDSSGGITGGKHNDNHGDNSLCVGEHLKTNWKNKNVVGMYNDDDDAGDYKYFVVGNGEEKEVLKEPVTLRPTAADRYAIQCGEKVTDTLYIDFKFTGGSQIRFRLADTWNDYYSDYYKLLTDGTLGASYPGFSIVENPDNPDYIRLKVDLSAISTAATGNPTGVQFIIAEVGQYSTAEGYVIANSSQKVVRIVRSNAFEVYANGSAKVGAMGNSDNSVVIKKYADDNFRDLRERIDGKTAGLYLYYADDLDAFEYMNLHKIDGTTFATQEELDEYVSGRDCGNYRFNSDDDMIEFFPADMYYIIFCHGSWDSNQRLVVKAESLSQVLHDKDTVIVVERGVPDRWFNGVLGFGANESKIDLTNVAKTDSWNTFTSSNDFYATQYFNQLDAYSISGRSSDGLIITGGTSDAPLNIDANLLPNTTNYFDIGSADEQWKDLYLSNSIHIGTANFNFSQSSDTAWVFKKGDNKTLMFGEVDNVYVEGTIMPSGNNRDLGSDNQYRKWRNLYLSNAMKIGNTSYTENNLKPMVSLTEAEYEALATKDPNTLYLIEE